jgi:hypothetical protein
VGRSPGEKAIGASTNARKIMPPIQTTSDKSMRKRRNDMSWIIVCTDRFQGFRLSKFQGPKIAEIQVLPESLKPLKL